MRLQKILLVDDEAGIVKMLETMLRKEGYAHMDAAFNGKEALEKVKKVPYDLILLDVHLQSRWGQMCWREKRVQRYWKKSLQKANKNFAGIVIKVLQVLQVFEKVFEKS